jgi:hypothetical protein
MGRDEAAPRPPGTAPCAGLSSLSSLALMLLNPAFDSFDQYGTNLQVINASSRLPSLSRRIVAVLSRRDIEVRRQTHFVKLVLIFDDGKALILHRDFVRDCSRVPSAHGSFFFSWMPFRELPGLRRQQLPTRPAYQLQPVRYLNLLKMTQQILCECRIAEL